MTIPIGNSAPKVKLTAVGKVQPAALATATTPSGPKKNDNATSQKNLSPDSSWAATPSTDKSGPVRPKGVKANRARLGSNAPLHILPPFCDGEPVKATE